MVLILLCILYWVAVYRLGMTQYNKAKNIATNPISIEANLTPEKTTSLKNGGFLFKMNYSFERGGQKYIGQYKATRESEQPNSLPTTVTVWVSSIDHTLHETQKWVLKNSKTETYTKLIPLAVLGPIVCYVLIYFIITRRFLKRFRTEEK